jgi:hypothetical protein
MYSQEDKAALENLFISLASHNEIWPAEILSENDCKIGFSEKAVSELAARIAECSAFDRSGIAGNFFDLDVDHFAAANAALRGDESWVFGLHDRLRQWIHNIAMDELINEEIFSGEELYNLIQANDDWLEMHAAWERECGEIDRECGRDAA